MSRQGWPLFIALTLAAVGWVLLHADPAAFDPAVVGWPRLLFGHLRAVLSESLVDGGRNHDCRCRRGRAGRGSRPRLDPDAARIRAMQ
ncbi:hypothetical protein CKJ56_09780 [Mycobacterium intracellulare subsp. chimaera]|nr:hypothetical protein CKJ58_10425 [Mycobacterium intracellulare subsp. chimaera]PBA63115.1 hypothetical protein CKJ56_09780 [Mycobacterium intracellulare subsp. chimaera]